MKKNKTKQNLREKFLKKSFQVRAGPVKRQKMNEKTQEHNPTMNDGAILPGLQRNALTSQVHIVVCKVNQGYEWIALKAR